MEFNEFFVRGMALLGAGIAMIAGVGQGIGQGIAAGTSRMKSSTGSMRPAASWARPASTSTIPRASRSLRSFPNAAS